MYIKKLNCEEKTFKYSNICLYLFYQRLLCSYLFKSKIVMYISLLYFYLVLSKIVIPHMYIYFYLFVMYISCLSFYPIFACTNLFYPRSQDCYVYIFLLGSAFSKLIGCSVLLLFAFSTINI